MNILYVTSEAVPYCKTGGLADVAGSLPQALAKGGDHVSVILPLYQTVSEKWIDQLHFEKWTYVRLAWRSVYCGLFSLEHEGVTWYFVDNEHYFKRPDLYGYYDDGERFAFFSRAVTELLPDLPEKPDVVHCNDWQSALVPIYIRDEAVRQDFYKGIHTVITVHNVEYQGRYGRDTLEDLFGLAHGWYDDGTMEFAGDVNLLKGAIVTADAVTAVSPTYAQELKYAYFAHGLEDIMNSNAGKLHGVLNGLDMERYNPSKDANLVQHYSPGRMAGKAKNKEQLQLTMGLQVKADTPIIAMVTRLVSHKGLDLVCDALDYFMEKDVQLVVLGKGDANYETFFNYAAARYPGRIGVYLGYSESLAMQIYAGADLFLMPSKSEPCGLSQMIAMRYGTVPIVRETGGLKDTVHAYEAWNGEGNGFTFADYNAGDMAYVICEAIDLYHDNRTAFKKLQKRGMNEDFSWTRSAAEYHNIYESICN
ncbi:MAG: glycogen synthase GlgA [Oscillospiraceae bacterium]|nr:glycogen synthase GlgA [Oscillospiraceae bacterium]